MSAQSKEVIARVRPQIEVGESLITLAEYGISASALTSFQQEIMLSQGQKALEKLGLSLVYEPSNAGIFVKLRASALVGTARFVRKNACLDVVVEPKVGTARVFEILEFIHRAPIFRSAESTAFSEKKTAADFVIGFILDQIIKFLERHYFRDYSITREVKSTGIRGRLLQEAYLRDSCPHLRFQKIPCEFFEYSQNTIENQIILSALKVVGRLLSLSSSGYRAELRRRVALGISLLPDVTDQFRDHKDIDALSYSAKNEAYRQIHSLCRFLLLNSTVSINPGQRVQFASFTFNMNSLFEEYVRSLLQWALGPALLKKASQHSIKIGGMDKYMRVDGLLKSDDGIFVLECKNKLVTSEGTPDFNEGDLDNADIYQAVAYAVHEDVQAVGAALFYPFITEANIPTRIVASTQAFIGANGRPFPLKIFLINMHSKPEHVANWFKNNRDCFITKT